MKKLLLVLGLIGSPVSAQEPKKENYSILYTSHVCDTYQNISAWIEGEFKEKLLFRGIGTAVYEDPQSYGELDGVMQYFVNQDSGTWSMVYVFDIERTCIMASGVNFQPYTD